jgi:hypothetical protein
MDMPEGYLAAIAVFCNEGRTKARWPSRAICTSVRILLLHKLREAMAEEMRGRVVGGEAKRLKPTADISAVT